MPEFLKALNEQVDATKAIVTFALIMARVMAIVVLVPYLGGKNAPPEVKMGIGATLTMILWPTVLSNVTGPLPLAPLAFVLMMLKETFIGLAIGFVAAEVFYVVELSGQLIDMLRGANQIQTMVPQITERSSAFGNLQYQMLIALFLSLDLHHVFIGALFESYVAVPINEFPRLGAGFWPFIDLLMRVTADVLLVGVSLAVPVGIVCLIVETAFGLLNRVAPQINAYFMAMPAKVIAGCMVYFLAAGMIIDEMMKHSVVLLERVHQVIDLLQ